MSTDRYARIVQATLDRPWAITPEKLAQIRELLKLRAAGLMLTDGEIAARLGAAKELAAAAAARAAAVGASTGGAIAVLPIFGVISHRMNMLTEFSGGTSTEKLGRQLRELTADDRIGGIVLDVDSPGGSVYGVPELAEQILEARATKPIVAVANATAASAAYWLTAAASEVVVTPSGDVGSVGVYMAHEDWSKALEAEGVDVTLIHAGKFKVEGNPFEPLGDEARTRMQAEVDHYYDLFVKGLAKARDVSVDHVREHFGQGRTLMPAAAKRAGMVDRIETFDAAVARLARQVAKNGNGAAAAAIDPAAVARAFDVPLEQLQASLDAPPADQVAQLEAAAAADLDRRRRRLALERAR